MPLAHGWHDSLRGQSEAWHSLQRPRRVSLTLVCSFLPFLIMNADDRSVALKFLAVLMQIVANLTISCSYFRWIRIRPWPVSGGYERPFIPAGQQFSF